MATEMQGVSTQTKRYLLEIRLDDGTELRAGAGDDLQAARDALSTIEMGGAVDAFIRFGDDTIVRGRDIRYVQVREDDRFQRQHDDVRSRSTGGHMSTYGTEETRRIRVRGQEDDARGGAFGGDEPLFGYGRRPWSETKPFFLTSEFLALLGAIAGVGIAMGVLDNFNANRGWLLITILAAAYMVSRGLAKSGTRDPNPSGEYREYR